MRKYPFEPPGEYVFRNKHFVSTVARTSRDNGQTSSLARTVVSGRRIRTVLGGLYRSERHRHRRIRGPIVRIVVAMVTSSPQSPPLPFSQSPVKKVFAVPLQVYINSGCGTGPD